MYSRFTLVRISINLNSSQLNMIREIILPIFRSTRLFVTACGVMHPHDDAGLRPAKSWGVMCLYSFMDAGNVWSLFPLLYSS